MTEIRQFLFGDGAEIGLLKRRAGKSEFLAFSFYLLATALLMCVYSVMNKFYGWQPAQKSVFYIYILVYVACSLGMVYHSTNRRLTLAFLGSVLVVCALVWYSVNCPMSKIPVVRVYHDSDRAASWFLATMWWLSLACAGVLIFRNRNFYGIFWEIFFGFWFGALVWGDSNLFMFSCGILCLALGLFLVWLFVKTSSLDIEEKCKVIEHKTDDLLKTLKS